MDGGNIVGLIVRLINKNMKNKSTAFVLILVLACFFSGFQAIACGYNILFVVTENGNQENLEEIVSSLKDVYSFEIEETNPFQYLASYNDESCHFELVVSLKINQNGNFITINAPGDTGLVEYGKDCLLFIKQIIVNIQKDMNLLVNTEAIPPCQHDLYR